MPTDAGFWFLVSAFPPQISPTVGRLAQPSFPAGAENEKPETRNPASVGNPFCVFRGPRRRDGSTELVEVQPTFGSLITPKKPLRGMVGCSIVHPSKPKPQSAAVRDMSSMELMTELLEAGVHFGHQTKRWNPKMKPFIFEKRNSIYIINLSETVKQLQTATDFLANVARQGGKILFIGCKKQAQEAVKEAATACGQFYVNQRWLGGTLTNLTTIRKSIGRLRYLETIEQAPEYSKMGKQELAALRREEEKLRRNLEGIREMDRLPDAMVVIDTTRESIAVAEAQRLGIPTVAIVDTNADPEKVTYPIAGNDDAIRAIRVILQKLVDAIYGASQESRKQDAATLAGVAE
jgi:small subunit ribosomal protein S2